MSGQTKAYVLAGLTVLCWSTVSTAFKLSLAGLGPIQLIFISMLTASLFLGLALLIRGKIGDALRPAVKAWPQALFPGLLIFVYYILLFEAYARLPAQIAQPINYTWSLILALLAAWLLGQKITKLQFLFMLVAYAGVVVIALGQSSFAGGVDGFGLGCVIASTAMYAFYWIVNTKSPLQPLPGLFICFSLAALLACLTLLVQGGLPNLFSREALPAVYVGLFELGIPFLLWAQALRLTDNISRLSTLPFLVPFLALFWIRLILKEPIYWTTPLGLGLIIAGTLALRFLNVKPPSETGK